MQHENHLMKTLRENSERDAIFAHDDENPMTYEQLFEGTDRITGRLLRLGLLPGDRVAARIEKSLAGLQLYLGTVQAGGVFLPLNPSYTLPELSYFLSDAEPAIIVCDPEVADEICGIAGVTSHILTLDRTGEGSLWEGAETGVPVVRAESELAAVLYTSGTTGRPKGAMLTHGNLASNATALAQTWAYSRDDILIHALPIFHTHGLFVATNVTLVSGASLRFHSKFDSKAILKDMARSTVLMGVPTFYTRLLKEPDLADQATEMRLFVSGSAPLLSETHQAWREVTGQAILERYGMSETNMNASNPYDGERRRGSVGLPLPGVEIRITSDDGVPLPTEEIGGIEVRGPNVFNGYWRLEEKTASEFRDDWFITGDIGSLSADGYLTIIGRSKDLIISGGYNVYPKEVEVILDELESVGDSAVIGVPHQDFGEAVVAVVVGSHPNVDEAKIIESCAKKLARYKQPKRIFFAESLPRNAMGKVQKKALRERYAETFEKET